jgi:hypothetical protein
MMQLSSRHRRSLGRRHGHNRSRAFLSGCLVLLCLQEAIALTSNFLNQNIVRLELLAVGNNIGTATGFFMKWRDQWYLITNWHVFSGREPLTGQPKHSSCAVPDSCRYSVLCLSGEVLTFASHELDLGSADEDTAKWYQHPTMGQVCDIAAIPVDAQSVGYAKDLLDEGGHDPRMVVDLGGELFLPGYPLGLSSNGCMAIWKRASLASSLEFGHGIRQFFYVDTATREGMSGAPCLAISKWRHYSLDKDTAKAKVVERPFSWRLLGVYSGRRNPSDGFEAQVGVVWREALIYDILAGKQSGALILRG